MKTKYILLIIGLFALPNFMNAQIYQQLPNFYHPIDSATIAKNMQEQQMKKGEADFGVTMGTGFSSFSGGMMNSYIAPNVQYQMTDNFRLNMTTMISTTNTNFGNGSSTFASQHDPKNFGISGSGIYSPSNKLTFSFSGTYLQDNSMQPFNRHPTQNPVNMDYKSMSLRMGYQISENSSLSIEFGFSNRQNGFYTPANPMYNGYHSPYGNQRFFW